MISIRIEGASVQEVHAQMRALLGSDAVPTPEAPVKTIERKSAEKAAPKAEPAPQTTAPKSETTEVAFSAVSAIIPKLVAKKGKPAAVELLAKFNAKKGGDLTPDQYGKFVSEAEALLA